MGLASFQRARRLRAESIDPAPEPVRPRPKPIPNRVGRRDVLRLRKRGHTVPEIAAKLGVSKTAIWYHLSERVRDGVAERKARRSAR